MASGVKIEGPVDELGIQRKFANHWASITGIEGKLKDHDGQIELLHRYASSFVENIERLAVAAQSHELCNAEQRRQSAEQSLAISELRDCILELKGYAKGIADRPSTVVNMQPERAPTPASSLELGNGTWKLRARGMLPMVLLLVATGALATVWILEHIR